MKAVSELLDMQTRGEDITPNPDNKVTKKRKGWKCGIMKDCNDNLQAAYVSSMSILENYMPRLQEFVLTHGEEPAPELPGLVQQVYQLRMQDVRDAVEMLDFDNETGLIHLEDQEALFIKENGYTRDEFLGELFAPIEIAYTYLTGEKRNSYDPDGYDPDGFLGADLAGGLIPIIGEKVNRATLIRAAQGKNAGILGALSTGGKRHYEALVAYFVKYPDIAKKVITGEISDESQLPNWRYSGSGGTDQIPNIPLLDPLRKQLVGDSLKQALPYIIGFLILLGVIVYFAARSKK